MRKAVILLSVLVLMAGGCKQAKKSRTEATNHAAHQPECVENAADWAAYEQLMKAVEADDHVAFDTLVKQITDINAFVPAPRDESYTLLGYACAYNRCELAKKLIELGADVDNGVTDGCIVQDALITAGEDVCLIKLLLAHGADPNRMQNEEGLTVLSAILKPHFYSERTDLDTVYAIAKLLIEHGAKVDGLGYTEGLDYVHYPLLYAVESGSIKLVQLLLDNNCNPDIEDREGNTPFSLAIDNNEMYRLLKEYSYARVPKEFLKRLANGEKLQSFFSHSWTLDYYVEDRCDGATKGGKTDLSPSEIDGIIKLKVRNDGDGLDCERKEPTEFYLDFSLQERVKCWDFEITSDGINQGKWVGVVCVEGGEGAEDRLILRYDPNSLITKIEYWSEVPR